MRDEYTNLIEELPRLQERMTEVNLAILKIRDSVVRLQDEKCAYCGTLLRTYRFTEHSAEIDCEDDYIPERDERVFRRKCQIRLKIPKSRGGEAVISNLVACCKSCGGWKGTSTHEECMRAINEAKRERQIETLGA